MQPYAALYLTEVSAKARQLYAALHLIVVYIKCGLVLILVGSVGSIDDRMAIAYCGQLYGSSV